MQKIFIASVVAIALGAAPASAQVYPERTEIKAKARSVVETAYQRRDRGDNREQQTERTRKTFRLGDGGWLALSNIAGDITVTRGTGAETVVEIVKTAHGRDTADAREQLQLVSVEATERAGRVEVKTRYPNGDRRNFNVSVAFNVSAPAGTEITAKTVSGNVEISDARVDGTLSSSSVSGDIVLRRSSARRIEATTLSGSVRLEGVECDRATASTTSGNILFSGPLAKNGRYELKGFSGDVGLQLSGDTGFEIDATTFSGQIRSDDFPVTSRGRISRRSLSGTYGDGSAILDLQTFSGSIIISKR